MNRKQKRELIKAVETGDPNLPKIAKKIWGEKGDRIVYDDGKHSVQIIYRYKWGYWKGRLQKFILSGFEEHK